MSPKIENKNPFLTKNQLEKDSLDFYAEFLFALDFHDSLYYQVQKHLLDYLANLKNLDNNIEITNFTDNVNNTVKVIIEVKKIGENSEQNLVDITTKLQKEFVFTAVDQTKNFGNSKNSILPLEIEYDDENSKEFYRYEYQKLLAQIINIKNQINNLETIIKNDTKEVDETREALNIQVKNNIKQLQKLLDSKLIPELEQAKQMLYLNIALKNNDFGEVKKISPELSDVIRNTDFQDNSSIEKLLEEIKQLTIENKTFATKLQEQLEKTVLDSLETIKSVAKYSGIEVQSPKDEYGIICDYKTNSNSELIKGKLVGNVDSNVILIGNIIDGFKIPGIEERFTSIKEIIKQNSNLHTFLGTFESGEKKIFTIENGEYVELKLNGIDNIENAFDFNLMDNVINNGYIKLKNGNIIYFYLEACEYKYFEIEGQKEFKSFKNIEKDKNGKPIYGEVEQEFGNLSYFYLENGEYKSLELEGQKEFEKFYNIEIDENGKPIFGEVKLEFGYWSYFYLESGEYKYLELEGQKEFKNFKYLKRDNNGKLISGIVKQKSWDWSYFYLEDGEYKYFEIQGQKEFEEFYNIEIDENGKPISGIVKLSGGKKKKFYLENGEYKYKRFWINIEF